MDAYIKMLLIGAAVAGLYAPTAAFAQKSGGGVVGGARLHPGTWSGQGSSRSMTRSQPTYRNATPESAPSESAPTSVAQKPTDQRSFSYEPKEEVKSSKEVAKASSGGCGCGNGSTVRTEPTPTTSAKSAESGRSYSYEPSTASSDSSVKTVQPTQRSYSSPRNRNGSGSSFSVDKAMRAKGY
jgi:hypothetical protein